MKRFSSLLLAITLSTISAWAYDFMADSIAYNINPDEKSVTVTHTTQALPSMAHHSSYKGMVVLPDSVTYALSLHRELAKPNNYQKNNLK